MPSSQFPQMPEEGTVAPSCLLPHSWPPATEMLVAHFEFSNGFITLVVTPAGKAIGTVNKDGSPRQVVSCQLRPTQTPMHTTIAMSWAKEEMTIYVGGKLAGSSPPKLNQTELVVEPLVFVSNENLSDENERALQRRAGTRGGTHPKKGRQRANDEYILSGLRNEYLQIKDLLSQIRLGRDYHVAGLAGHLRTLIADTKQPIGGLLQWCAAAITEPLILYVDPRAKRTIIKNAGNRPVKGPAHPLAVGLQSGIVFSGVSDKTGNLIPVDLDVWLSMAVARIKDDVYTNRQLLHIVGSTVASHFDVDHHPLVGMMQSSTLRNQAGLSAEMLNLYVCNVAEIVIRLCGHILTRTETGLSP